MNLTKNKPTKFLFRKTFIIKVSIFLIFVFLIFIKFSPSNIANFNSVMSGCLSFSSISSSLIFGSFSFINYSDGKASEIVKSMNGNIKIMSRLLSSSAILFLVSIISLLELMLFKFNSVSFLSTLLTSLWLSLLLYGALCVFYIFDVIFYYLKLKKNVK
ncbi:hypothetical protein DY113_05555 [Apilactobacillus micheneri]|uniref:hypothetical protein n=1 Tax=Apilactobacillus micheneri TaxID=1899430 RepID=UPI000D0383A3|nr:hypothetical protein [Apilactobacillus micheneri]TPR27622.1 hypothetical protein DY113_05555 [Apilactobacillus micheneri]TPR28887.1 hypothetical protein DY117_06455 [Apilactobacillus micheneri]TPR30127.1 hypothetical protein DY127_04495 [Apilactobacillus micheneri]TPR34400.1 hypothetical protein DY122_06455 [Apilactobacillus micheneri]TPR35116.1 hypothetical protein DY116_06335 [Apilactobacillus micheneri]